MWNRNCSCVGKIASLFGVLGFFAGSALASTVTVDANTEYQVIRGFGGMVHNEWQGGKGLSDADAKLAFGTGDGQIGLNTLRIPVYGNSNSFNKDVAAAKSAKKYAGNDFILYATPWTSNYAGAGQHIASSNYQKYVDHLNSFAEYMINQGVPLYALSISNEPDWCGEWACWSADEIYNFTRDYAAKMRKHGTKVISTESFAYAKGMYDKVLKDDNVLKNWDILGAHFYASEAYTADSWFQYSLADQKNVERWMTEHYTESQGSGNYWRKIMNTGDQANQNKKDTVRAMDVAYDIHRALAIGNFNQYTWWYIRRCYGLIMETDFSNKLSIPSNEVGKVSKRGYIMSQFARFIRPGAVRVGATLKPETDVHASAYKSANGDSVIVVLLNRDARNAKTVTVNIKGADVKTVRAYMTSENKNAEYLDEYDVVNGSVTIKMESGSSNKDCIVTLVGAAAFAPPTPREPFKGEALAIPGKIQAEDFDIPGTGNANKTFYDTDSENHSCSDTDVSECSDYRKDTGVDIYKKSFGNVVGYNRNGEWLEYTVKVAKSGDYTMFAYVASNNGTASFQLLMDGKAITDTIVAPATTSSEGNFDSFDKIQRNVTLTEGEHILRFQVTSDWLDVDYFTFVEGKDATDPEPVVDPEDPEDTTSIVKVRFDVAGEQNYSVFDMNGNLMGSFKSESVDLQNKTADLVKAKGSYLVKSVSGSAVVNVTK